MNAKLGPKNQADLFFFSENKGMAEGYCQKLSQEPIQPASDFWITSACTTDDITILDLSTAGSVLHLLYILSVNELDVLSNSFLTYDEGFGDHVEHLRTFSIFRADFEQVRHLIAKACLENSERALLSQVIDRTKLNGTYEYAVSYFGQRLTDFKNGTSFRALLSQHARQIDGYRWREHNDPRGLTYCLFSANKLGAPVQEKFIVTV